MGEILLLGELYPQVQAFYNSSSRKINAVLRGPDNLAFPEAVALWQLLQAQWAFPVARLDNGEKIVSWHTRSTKVNFSKISVCGYRGLGAKTACLGKDKTGEHKTFLAFHNPRFFLIRYVNRWVGTLQIQSPRFPAFSIVVQVRVKWIKTNNHNPT